MDKEEMLASTTTQKPTTDSAAWKLIAILGIAVASWTVKTTFGPEQYRYHTFVSGDYHRLLRVEAKTGEVKIIYPHR